MRLISCHIVNFGHLSDETVDFTAGLNRIEHENGWGKSTFAAFLCVMFYGFDGERKTKSIRDNERNLYKPWQGGTYGGSVVFESSKGRFELMRTFGVKADADTFRLLDADTHLETTAYTQSVGEELFGIDRESFCRTILLRQSDAVTYATDGVHAKLGSGAESMMDLGDYKAADERLEEARKLLSPSSKKGELYRLTDEINELTRQTARLSAVTDSLSRLDELIGERENKLTEYRAEQTSLLKKQDENASMRQLLALRETYRNLAEEERIARLRVNRLRDEFGGNEPTESEIERAMSVVKSLGQARAVLERFSLSEDDLAEIEKCKRVFGDDPCPQTLVSEMRMKWTKRCSIIQGLSSRKDNLEAMNLSVRESRKRRNSPLILLGIVCILFGLIIAVNMSGDMKNSGLMMLVAGVVILLLTVILGWSRSRRGASSGRRSKQKETYSVYDRAVALADEIAADEEYVRQAEYEVGMYLNGCGCAYDENTVDFNLQRLLQHAIGYQKLLEKESENDENYSRALEDAKRFETELNAFLTKYNLYVNEDENPETLILSLSGKVREYDLAKESCYVFAERLATFRSKNGWTPEFAASVESMPELGELESAESVSAQLRVLNETIEKISEELASYRHQAEVTKEELDDLRIQTERLEELTTRKAELALHYDNLKIAEELLTQARDRMVARYTGPIMASFVKYYGTVVRNDTESGIPGDAFRMDAETQLQLVKYGQQWSMDYLSRGYRDLIGFCQRMAFADAMYEGEKPFVILDDPFVNLDSDKTIAAERLLGEIEKSYQIIYLTAS